MKIVRVCILVFFLLLISTSSTFAFTNRSCSPTWDINPFCDGPPIHEEITTEGLLFLKPSIVDEIADQHAWVDWLYFEDSDWHFDDCEFRDTTEKINQLYGELIGYLDPKSFDSENAQETFGELLHPIQDFYSHSNWIESTPAGALVDEGKGLWQVLTPYTVLNQKLVIIQGENIPDGISLNRNGKVVNVIASPSNSTMSPGVYSGIISGSTLVADDCPDGPDDDPITISHGDLNKDVPSLSNHFNARQRAVEQTRHEWCRLVNLVEDRYKAEGVAKLFSEWVSPNISDNDKIAASCGHVETVLMIDSSGSMSDNDPQRRRIDAAKAFIDAAQEGDSVAVVRFSGGASVLYELRTILSPDDREVLKEAVDSVGQSGGTNINAALNTGFQQLLYGSAMNRKVGVLLTDGDHNVGEFDPQTYEQFAEQGWTIHTIDLDGGSGVTATSETDADADSINAVNSELLIEIAAATGGEFYSADNANELVQVFKAISSRTTRAEEIANSKVTLIEGTDQQLNVELQDSNSSATFFTNWNDGDVNMTLTTPSGVSISPTTENANVYHASTGIYELYTVQNPQNGQWKVNLSGSSLSAEGEIVNTQVTAINGLDLGLEIYLPFVTSSSNGTTAPPPSSSQQFAINIGDVVGIGTPRVGAGNIESAGSKDIYTFTASPGQVIFFDERGASGSLRWSVQDSSDTSVFSEQTFSTTDPGLRVLDKGGIYTITVRGSSDTGTGTYQFRLFEMPTPQTFSINIDDVVPVGIPAVGAGRIEFIGSKDIYTFNASPGQLVYFDEQGASDGTRWQVQDANGTTVFSEQLLSTSDAGFRTLDLGGEYTISVRGSNDTDIGTYQFQILSMPDPQQFSISINNIISDGVPVAGAGNIEAIGSKDVYTFTATPGQSVYFDEQGSSGGIRWQVQDANEAVIVSDQTLSTNDPGLEILELGGTYTITVRGSSDTGIGTYQFQVLSIPDPELFSININDVVSDGVPAAGAGNIEALGSRDIYTFTAAAGQSVFFDEQGSVGSIRWQVQDANGTIIVSDQSLTTSGDPGLILLELGGTYTITVRGSNDSSTGTYQFQVLSIPAPQLFSINIDDVISDGVPVAGAGNIEAIGSRDIYTFSAASGLLVYFDEQGSSGGIRWQVQDENGATVFSDQYLSTSDAGYRTLELGGTYTITVRGSSDSSTGAYQFQVRSIPEPEQFSINIGDVVSDGIPAAGAGNIEAIGSRDIYTFTATPGQVVSFDEQGSSGGIRWQVQDADGTTIVSDQTLSTGDPGLRTLELGGVYTITVRGSSDTGTGTYQFQVTAE